MAPENKQYIRCNLCQSEDYRYLDYRGSKIVAQCNICGLVYRNPRFLSKPDRESDSVRNYGDYVTMEERVSIARERIFRKTLLGLEKKIKNPDRCILDIGCGQGYFLKAAKEKGWQVQGVEPVKSACEYAKQKFAIDIVNATIEEARFKDNSFDVVSMWNVLDHVSDPLGILSEIRRSLKPNGIIVARIPNVSWHFFCHSLFSVIPLWFTRGRLKDPSVVINYGYSNKTLKKLFKKSGFMSVRVRNSIPSSGDPYRSLRLVKDRSVMFLKNIYFVLSQIFYYFSLRKCTIGTALIVYARK